MAPGSRTSELANDTVPLAVAKLAEDGLVWRAKIEEEGFMRILIAITLLFWAHLASAEAVRIASWNIEHLVTENDRGCRPRNYGDFQRVRDVIEQVDADVWLLQEIEGVDALARVFDPEEWVFHVEERRPSRSYPECRNRPGQRLAMPPQSWFETGSCTSACPTLQPWTCQGAETCAVVS